MLSPYLYTFRELPMERIGRQWVPGGSLALPSAPLRSRKCATSPLLELAVGVELETSDGFIEKITASPTK